MQNKKKTEEEEGRRKKRKDEGDKRKKKKREEKKKKGNTRMYFEWRRADWLTVYIDIQIFFSSLSRIFVAIIRLPINRFPIDQSNIKNKVNW